MRKTLKVVVSVFMVATVVAACSPLNKMKKMATNIKYDVTPEVLETHGGMVDVKIVANIPAKYFNKNVIVEATPVIKFDGGEKAFQTKLLQGERVQDNNTVVPYESGKTITYTGKISYEEAMRISDLEIRLTARHGEKSLAFDPLKIADGVVATATLVQNAPKAAVGGDNFQRIIAVDKEADIHYLINSSAIQWKERVAGDVKELSEFAKEAKKNERQELKGFKIKAYASPDGELDFNEKLANRRGVTSKNFISRKLRRLEEFKMEDFFNSEITAEDWEGFKELMEKSDIQDKELILRVLSMYQDPEVREKEIKNISAVFKQIAKDILPKLRRSQLILTVDNIGYSDEELRDIIKNDAAKLNVDEVLYSATLFDNNADKLNIYGIAQKQFPNDWRGFNDAGTVLFNMGKVAEAKSNFEKADRISSDNKVVKNNLGAVALVNGDIKNAEMLFGAASGEGQEVEYNNGIVAIMKANYDEAVKYFANDKSVNAALASILAGNNNAALQILNSAGDDAIVSYMKAVVGARTNNEGLIFKNLKAAVAKDASFKGLAKTDMEFAKYFENAEFKSIVE